MKGLKNILFNSKQEKLTEKAFTQSIAISVIGILLCIVALCSVTWAWFSEDVSSNANTIKSGTYSLRMEIKPTDDASTTLTGEETDGNYKGYKYALEVGKTYTVTLTAEGSDSNGYCKILVDGIAQPYYTGIVPSTPSGENPYTFTFEIEGDAETTVDVTFELRWGMYSGNPDVSNGKLVCTLPSQNN